MPTVTVPRDPSNAAYQLIPTDMLAVIPKLYATEQETDPMVYIKLFTPDSSWTWFLTEYSPDDRMAFGLVVGLETELGYVSLEELESVRGPLGLPVERDLSWRPTRLSEVRKE